MKPAQIRLIENALTFDADYWRDMSTAHKTTRESKILKIEEAREMFRKLVDTHRWRKQSEEPAPTLELVLCYGKATPDRRLYELYLGYMVGENDYWLPLPQLQRNNGTRKETHRSNGKTPSGKGRSNERGRQRQKQVRRKDRTETRQR